MTKINKIEGNFALFTINDTKIMLPQSDIGKAEYFSSDTQWISHKTKKGVFLLEDSDESLFVFLSKDLQLEDTLPKDRFISLTLNDSQQTDDQKLFWVWSSVQVLVNKQFELMPLFDFVYDAESPVLGYVIYNNSIVYYCDTKKLISNCLGEVL